MPRIIHLLHQTKHLERVVLRRNLLLEEGTQRSPHHDVVANLGDLGEEEQGEETGNAAESAGEDTAVLCEYAFEGRGEREGEGGTYAFIRWRAVMPWKLRWMVYLGMDVSLVLCACNEPSLSSKAAVALSLPCRAEIMHNATVLMPSRTMHRCASCNPSSCCALPPRCLCMQYPSVFPNTRSYPPERKVVYVLRTERTPVSLVRAALALFPR
jgi:hypothetical protein